MLQLPKALPQLPKVQALEIIAQPPPPPPPPIPQPLPPPVQQGPDPQRRVIRVKRKSTTPAVAPPSTSGSNACIICARSFATSEEVQRHLLTVHVNKRREEEQDTGKADENIKVKEEKVEEVVVEVKEEVPEISQEETMLDDEMEEEGDDDEEPDIQIDEEHYSINHVEVNIAEKGNEPLNESDYCPIIDDSICIVDQQEEEEEEEEEMQDDDEDEDEEDDQTSEETEQQQQPMEVVGEVGKAPIYLKCQVGAFSSRGSLLEFSPCTLYYQPFLLRSALLFFLPSSPSRPTCGGSTRRASRSATSLSAATSAAKASTSSPAGTLIRARRIARPQGRPSGCFSRCIDLWISAMIISASISRYQRETGNSNVLKTFRCPLCPSVTNSKNGMRRHLRNR